MPSRRKRTRHVITMTRSIPGFEESALAAETGKLKFVAFNLSITDLRALWEFEQFVNRITTAEFRIEIEEMK